MVVRAYLILAASDAVDLLGCLCTPDQTCQYWSSHRLLLTHGHSVLHCTLHGQGGASGLNAKLPGYFCMDRDFMMRRVLVYSRYIVVIAVAGTFVAALALLVYEA